MRRMFTTSAAPEFPPRPYLPPAAAGAAGALVAAALGLEFGWRSYIASDSGAPGQTAFAVLAVSCAVGILCIFVRPFWGERMRRWARWLGIGVVLGAASATLGAMWRASAHERMENIVASACIFEVEGDPSMSSYGVQHTARMMSADGAVLGRVRLDADSAYEDGTRLRLVGRASSLPDSAWGRSRYMAGEVTRVSAVRIIDSEPHAIGPIEALRALMLDVIQPDASQARALVAGIVCGRTTELDQASASEVFARTGTSHLVAVSGSHLALVTSLAQVFLAFVGAHLRTRYLLLVLLMSSYVILTGGSASAVRSLIMVGLTLVASWGERRGHGISALALTTMALVARDAGVVFDVGFQLSAVSVLFIQLFYRYLSYLLVRLGMPRPIAEPLSLTLCAQWGTLPITIPIFGTCSIVAPLANLVLGPVMSALLVVGLVSVPLAAIVGPLADVLLAPAGALASISVFGAQALAGFPYASIAMAASPATALPYLAACVVYAAWLDASRWQVAVVCAAIPGALAMHLVRWTLFAPASVTVLDVGQADAILVREGSAAILVDAGVDSEVADALARNSVFQLDAVVITHWDLDHYGGLEDVLASVSVSRVVVAEGALDAMPEELVALDMPEVVELSEGDALSVGGFACTMVWPEGPVEGSDNEDSVALAVRYDSGGCALDMLLAGDTEIAQEERYAGRVGDIDVLKLGHHGSAASVDAALMAQMRPELAIASAGEGNSYGHPTKECIDTVEASGARFLCTIDVGDVTIRPARGGFSVSTGR